MHTTVLLQVISTSVSNMYSNICFTFICIIKFIVVVCVCSIVLKCCLQCLTHNQRSYLTPLRWLGVDWYDCGHIVFTIYVKNLLTLSGMELESKKNARECVSRGAAGAQICRSLGHHLLHWLILRLLVLFAPAVLGPRALQDATAPANPNS